MHFTYSKKFTHAVYQAVRPILRTSCHTIGIWFKEHDRFGISPKVVFRLSTEMRRYRIPSEFFYFCISELPLDWGSIPLTFSEFEKEDFYGIWLDSAEFHICTRTSVDWCSFSPIVLEYYPIGGKFPLTPALRVLYTIKKKY